MTIHKLDKRVYFGQKAFIQKADELLVLRDPDSVVAGQTGLDMPGGKYRWGSDPQRELRREVQEETNLKIEIGQPFVVYTYYGDKRKKGNSSHTVLVGYFCNYKSGKVTLSDEHDKYEWVDKKSYKKWEDKTETFQAVKTYFNLKSQNR